MEYLFQIWRRWVEKFHPACRRPTIALSQGESDDRRNGPKRSKMTFGFVPAARSGPPNAMSGNGPGRTVKRNHGRRRRPHRRKRSMKKYLIATAMAALLSNSAFAAKIGVSMDKFDDNFLTVLRNRIAD
jgi:hypothetical protein